VVTVSQDGAPAQDERRPSVSEQHPAMRLLRAGIPLSLLLDLADPNGPDTQAIMEAERKGAGSPRPAGPRELVVAGGESGFRHAAEA
jgi:hypothetical protein